MNNSPPTFRQFYYHLGLELSQRGDRLIGRCPFCDKEDHFSVTIREGIFNCLRCGTPHKQKDGIVRAGPGNCYTFLTMLHELGMKTTSEQQYEILAANRGLKASTLKVAEICHSPLNSSWLIPSKNEALTITNLYQAIPTEVILPPKPRLPPGSSKRPPSKIPPNGKHKVGYDIRSCYHPCQQCFYGVELLDKQTTLVICEGHWDRLAMWELFAHLSPIFSVEIECFDALLDTHFNLYEEPDYFNACLDRIGILGLPGAVQFKSEWCKHLRDRHVITCLDNDPDRVICMKCKGRPDYKAHLKDTACPLCNGRETTGVVINPGREGTQKILHELEDTGTYVRSFRQLEWRPRDPKDIRDVLLA